jgi:N-acetylneuraminic acid mutarotase
MHLYRSPRSSFLTLLLVASGAVLAVVGCSDQVELPDSAALRRAFPDQAAAVLAQGEGFVATERGFARSAPAQASAWSRVEAELPSVGEGSIRLRTRGGFEVSVREVGAEGRGSLVERAVAYRRAGGTAYWTAVAGGVEEWLHLARSRGDVAAAWEVEGALLEQRGEQVALVDAAGVARLWVSAPAAYAAGGRPVRAGLRVEGARIELSVEAEGEEVLVDPAWSAVAPMNTARAEHSATLLPNGKVLVVGGAGSLYKTELYDAKMSSWTPIPEPKTPGRTNPTVARLGNGMVYVAGGLDLSNVAQKSVERYDWVLNTWADATPMGSARENFRATLLGNGKMLVSGGGSPSSELFDGSTWTPPKVMDTDRYAYTATLLGNGKVLIAGGEVEDKGALLSAELYDAETDMWSTTGSLVDARAWHSATLLGNGKVLSVGGVATNKSRLPSAELYDPDNGMWLPAGQMSNARFKHTATLLPNGRVLIVGGIGKDGPLKSAEVYDPGTNTWSQAGEMNEARRDHTATLLTDGRVLIAGGTNKDGNALPSAELYALLPLGTECTGSDECQSGYCVAGICCNTACNTNPCESCSAAQKGICGPAEGTPCDDRDPCTSDDKCTNDGSCAGAPMECKSVDKGSDHSIPKDAPDFTLCTSDRQCEESETAKGQNRLFCADGVCCNTECKGQCTSCVLEDSIGDCTPQKDRDLRHECHTGYFCNATCQPNSMGGGVCETATTSARCAENECSDDGVHGIGPASCAEDPATKALSCATDTRQPFDCTPYRCVKAFGQCMPYCNSIDDCAPGFVCNKSKGDCVPPPDKAYSQTSGCALAAGGATGDAAGLGALIAGLAAAWRRRRARPMTHRLH